MRRREFIGIALSALALPSVARSEKAVPLVGWLSGRSATDEEAYQKAFHSGLSELGYEVGRNVRFEYRYAGGKYDQLQSLADELVGLHVNAIVAVASYPVVLAAKKSTSTIPVIFSTGVDPVRFGLVQSMNRPGGNLTGVAVLSNELAAKRIGLLDELLPGAVSIAVLVNSANPAYGDDLRHAEEAIRKLGREFILVQASNKSEIETAFTTIEGKRAALLVWNEAYLNSESALIVSLSERYSIPGIYGIRRFAEIGGLISYGPDILQMYRLLGNYAAKVLLGTRPADLPVVQPTKYELVINLKTAKALGLTMSPSLLASADQVIE